MAETTMVEREDLLHVTKPVSRLSWGGIIAGAVAAIALGMLFISLGAAIGLTSLNPAQSMQYGGGGGATAPIASGIWLFLSIVLATFLGAWIGSRHSTLFVKRDAAAQGTVVWALSLLLALVYVGWTGGMLASTSSQLVGSTLQTAGNVASGGAQALPQTQLGQEMQRNMDPERLQQQIQQQMPSGQQIQQPLAQAAETASNVGAAFSWWFFATALFGLIAGILGGLAGLPGPIRQRPLEARRQPLRQSESRA